MIPGVSKCCRVIVLASLLFLSLPVMAQSEQSLKDGLAAYGRRDYRTAVQHLSIVTAKGAAQPAVYLYLAYAFTGCGDQRRALDTYCQLMSKYPTSPESQTAFHQAVRIDPLVASRYSSVLPAAKKVVSAPGQEAFIDRVFITPPQYGHSPVSARTVELVKRAIRKVRAPYYKMLSESGATFTVAPNSMDRWPGHKDIEAKADGTESVIGEMGGQTYHRDNGGPDIGLFERPMIRGTTKLQEPFTDESIYHCAIHEMGHGIDDLMRLSLNAEFLLKHKDDIAAMNEDARSENTYYLKPMEACSEITGALIGDNVNDSQSKAVMQAFPRSTQWLRAKLGIW